VREFAALFSAHGLEVVPQQELGVRAAEEPHSTFLENALAKARHAATATGLAAVADDSGLCVVALDGAPGVRSARFAGNDGSDSDNNMVLLRRMSGIRDRRAHYTCVLVALRSAEDPEPLVVEARWHGAILDAPRGCGGFGYDPLFFVPAEGKAAAELQPAVKNRISHRGLALAELAHRLAEWR
jgi:XTP/dITP diphosphohydrolase